MRWNLRDNYGNELLLESGRPYTIRLILKGKRPKLIGHYDAHTKTLIVKRNSARHYHYVSKSYGFNHEVMTSLEIDKVQITIDKELFEVPIDEFKYAKHLNFSQQGFELQKFLPVEIIRKYAVPLM